MNVTERHLRYFTNEEFVREGRNWLPMYNPRLLILLDVFRHLTGPCILSPHPLALGRIDYPKNPTTLHKYDEQDGVRAIDIFPNIQDMSDMPFGGNLENNVLNWIDKAQLLGFGGIGIYTQWTYKGKQRPGMHLDIRSDYHEWGYVDGEFVSIEKALEFL